MFYIFKVKQNVIKNFYKGSEHLKRNGSYRTIADQSGIADIFGIPKSPKFHSSNIQLLGKVEFENILVLDTGTTKNLVSYSYPVLETCLKKIIESRTQYCGKKQVKRIS